MPNPSRARGTTLVLVGLVGVTLVGGALWLMLKSAAPRRAVAPQAVGATRAP